MKFVDTLRISWIIMVIGWFMLCILYIKINYLGETGLYISGCFSPTPADIYNEFLFGFAILKIGAVSMLVLPIVNLLFGEKIGGLISKYYPKHSCVAQIPEGEVVCPCCGGVKPMKTPFGDPMWRCPLCQSKGFAPSEQAAMFETRTRCES